MAQPTKKPNSFSKGMMSDIDANALPPDTYKSAINARLVTKEDNSFVLKNAKGNTLFTTLSDSEKTITISDTLALGSTNISGLTTPVLMGWKLTISGDGDFTTTNIQFVTGDSIGNGPALVLGQYSGTNLIDSNYFMSAALITAVLTPAINAKLNISIDPIVNGVYKIRYSDKTTEAMTIVIAPYVQTGNPSNGSEGFLYTVVL